MFTARLVADLCEFRRNLSKSSDLATASTATCRRILSDHARSVTARLVVTPLLVLAGLPVRPG